MADRLIYKGKIVGGNKIGRKMGIPTVNIPVEDNDLPQFGVYIAKVCMLPDVSDLGQCIYLNGVANLGVKPTVENRDGVNPIAIEVNLFDFNEDIYGKEITVELVEFVRAEMKFENLGKLKAQIEKDINTAKLYFAKETLLKDDNPVAVRGERARDNFLKGYTCAQAVLLAFSDILDVDEKSLARIASGFGGGMGRLREVCGTVSGMFMVLNLLEGFEITENAKVKGEHYEKIQELAKRFTDANGSIVCRQLLGLSIKHDEPTPCERTEEYYKKRPCPELVASAAQILTEFILGT